MANRNETLDAFRGVAAICVLVYHLNQVGLTGDLVPHGYLAVDLFFILSGVVIPLAYEQPIRDGLGVSKFILRRAIRIYPLAIVGLIFGIVVRQMYSFNYGESISLKVIALNLALIPDITSGNGRHHGLFPDNGALWSLFFELWINIVWAWIGVRLRTGTLIGIALISAVCVCVLTYRSETANLGWSLHTFLGGLARVFFGFTTGIIIYRLVYAAPLSTLFALPAKLMPLVTCSLIVGVMSFPFASPNAAGIAFDMIAIVVILPAFILLASKFPVCFPMGAILGELSFPMYVIHYPIIRIVSYYLDKSFTNSHVLLTTSFCIGICLIASFALLYGFDQPIRNLLRNSVKKTGHKSDNLSVRSPTQ